MQRKLYYIYGMLKRMRATGKPLVPKMGTFSLKPFTVLQLYPRLYVLYTAVLLYRTLCLSRRTARRPAALSPSEYCSMAGELSAPRRVSRRHAVRACRLPWGYTIHRAVHELHTDTLSWGSLMLGGGARADILCYVMNCILLCPKTLITLRICLR